VDRVVSLLNSTNTTCASSPRRVEHLLGFGPLTAMATSWRYCPQIESNHIGTHHCDYFQRTLVACWCYVIVSVLRAPSEGGLLRCPQALLEEWIDVAVCGAIFSVVKGKTSWDCCSLKTHRTSMPSFVNVISDILVTTTSIREALH
jgi:hypothetical protein